MAFVTVSTFSFLAMSNASGYGGASAILMYPSKPFSRSHRRRAAKMLIVSSGLGEVRIGRRICELSDQETTEARQGSLAGAKSVSDQ